jgi:hypothetical protein
MTLKVPAFCLAVLQLGVAVQALGYDNGFLRIYNNLLSGDTLLFTQQHAYQVDWHGGLPGQIAPGAFGDFNFGIDYGSPDSAFDLFFDVVDASGVRRGEMHVNTHNQDRSSDGLKCAHTTATVSTVVDERGAPYVFDTWTAPYDSDLIRISLNISEVWTPLQTSAQWVALASGADVSQSIETSWSESSSHTDSQTLTTAVEMGVKFPPIPGGFELSGKASLSVASTVADTYSKTQGGSSEVTASVKCSDGSLFQWQVRVSRPVPFVDVTFKTDSFVCVPSSRAFTDAAPKCPPFYCANPDSAGPNAGCSCCNSASWTLNPQDGNVCATSSPTATTPTVSPTGAAPTTASPTPSSGSCCRSTQPQVPDSWCQQVDCDPKYSHICAPCRLR